MTVDEEWEREKEAGVDLRESCELSVASNVYLEEIVPHHLVKLGGEGDRPTAYLVTAFVTQFDRSKEPVVKGKGLECIELAAYQLETAPSTEFVHVHLTLKTTSRLAFKAFEALLKCVFPVSGREGKDVRIATKGTSTQALINYCSKPEERLEGTTPHFYNCERSGGKLQKRKLKDLEAAIQSCDTNADLAAGHLSGIYQHTTTAVTQVHAERPLDRPVLKGTQRLYAWECALLGLLLMAPTEDSETLVHWFVPKSAMDASITKPVVVPRIDKVARIVQRVLGAKKQAAQVAYYASNHPKDALLNHLSCKTRVVFVRNIAEEPLSPDFLLSLKSDSMGHRSHGGRYDLQELECRHVVVFSHVPPPPMSNYHRNTTVVWPIDVNLVKWEHRGTLLAHGERVGEGGQFLNFATVGCSGALECDMDVKAVAEAVAN